MRNPGGYATLSGPEGTRECDTFTCKHCNRVVFVKPKQKPEEMGGHCHMCDGLICAACSGQQRCVPFEKKLDLIEANAHAYRSYGIK